MSVETKGVVKNAENTKVHYVASDPCIIIIIIIIVILLRHS